MRKSMIDKTLVECRNVDTYVIDGRYRQSNYEIKPCVENGQMSFMLVDRSNNIDSTKVWKLFVEMCLYIQLFFRIYFWFHLTYNLLSINPTRIEKHTVGYQANFLNNSQEMYHLNHLKLAQLLIDGDVESNPGPVNDNCETPKGRGGRPKKTKAAPRGIAKKKLDFSNVDINMSVNHANQDITNKISVVRSDILNVKCEVIVNAAKND